MSHDSCEIRQHKCFLFSSGGGGAIMLFNLVMVGDPTMDTEGCNQENWSMVGG